MTSADLCHKLYNTFWRCVFNKSQISRKQIQLISPRRVAFDIPITPITNNYTVYNNTAVTETMVSMATTLLSEHFY